MCQFAMRHHVRVPVVTSVNLAVVRTLPGIGPSGIDKRPVDRAVRFEAGGVVGDSVQNLRLHGGPDKAAYVYAGEDADWWAGGLDRPVPPGALGENLTTRGIELTGAVIGERWRVGSVLAQVAQPRQPCTKLQAFWAVPGMVRRFSAANRPGVYLRVLEPGQVQAGDEITVLDRPAHGVTIGEVFRALNGERDLLPHVLRADELPARLRGHFRRLATLSRR
jgi:MOSC domain-containing protein YiiM